MDAGRDQRRSERVFLKSALRVNINSIGSDFLYNLESDNISTKGFFLKSDSPGRFPFTSKSIIEVNIEIERNKKVISFLAKMIRKLSVEEAEAEGATPGIAILLIQISGADKKSLENFVYERLEKLDQETSQGAA